MYHTLHVILLMIVFCRGVHIISSSVDVFQFHGYTSSTNFTCHCQGGSRCDETTGFCSSGCDDVTLPWAPWSGVGCMHGNVAYNKPAHQSQVTSVQTTTIITDGEVTSNSSASYTCADSPEGFHPFIRVDLEGNYVIREVTVRFPEFHTEEMCSDLNLLVLISDNALYTSEQEAHCQLNETSHGIQTFLCNEVIGRYVRIQGTVQDVQICLVEVDVQGYQYYECNEQYEDDFRYGLACMSNCHCTEQCHPVSGLCRAACKRGFDGDDCQSCAASFTSSQCDECIRGHTGVNCDMCDVGYSGVNCSECTVGYTDGSRHTDDCEGCVYKYWKSHTNTCTPCNCLTDETCDRILGLGCAECAHGFMGLHCNITMAPVEDVTISMNSNRQKFVINSNDIKSKSVSTVQEVQVRLNGTEEWVSDEDYLINSLYNVRIVSIQYDEERQRNQRSSPSEEVSIVTDCGAYATDMARQGCKRWCQCEGYICLKNDTTEYCNSVCDTCPYVALDNHTLDINIQPGTISINITTGSAPMVVYYEVGVLGFRDKHQQRVFPHHLKSLDGLTPDTEYIISISPTVQLHDIITLTPAIHKTIRTKSLYWDTQNKENEDPIFLLGMPLKICIAIAAVVFVVVIVGLALIIYACRLRCLKQSKTETTNRQMPPIPLQNSLIATNQQTSTEMQHLQRSINPVSPPASPTPTRPPYPIPAGALAFHSQVNPMQTEFNGQANTSPAQDQQYYPQLPTSFSAHDRIMLDRLATVRDSSGSYSTVDVIMGSEISYESYMS